MAMVLPERTSITILIIVMNTHDDELCTTFIVYPTCL